MYDVNASFNARMIVDAIRSEIAGNADNGVDIDYIASKFSSVPKNESLVMELLRIASKERRNDVYLSEMIAKYADKIELDSMFNQEQTIDKKINEEFNRIIIKDVIYNTKEESLFPEAGVYSKPIEFGQGQNSDLNPKLDSKQNSDLNPELDSELESDLNPEIRAMIEKIKRLEAAKESEERYNRMVSEGKINPEAGLTPKPKL